MPVTLWLTVAESEEVLTQYLKHTSIIRGPYYDVIGILQWQVLDFLEFCVCVCVCQIDDQYLEEQNFKIMLLSLRFLTASNLIWTLILFMCVYKLD